MKNKNVQIGTTPADNKFKIKVIKGGPYKVSGSPKLRIETITQNAEGKSWEFKEGQNFEIEEGTILCRCGASKHKPYCDGSHVLAKVNLDETAGFEPQLDNAEIIQGPKLSLSDNEKFCAFSRFCDSGDRVWVEVTEEGKEHEELTKHQVHHCVGGRLLVWDNKTEEPIEIDMEPAINIIEDPKIDASGPLMVTGGIPVESENGEVYEIRTRQALCRCGQSSNKPFCDGSHASIHFNDGLR